MKSAFTRSFNKQGLPARTTIMVEDGKKGGTKRGGKGGGAATAAAPADAEADDGGLGGELAEVRLVRNFLRDLWALSCWVDKKNWVGL